MRGRAESCVRRTQAGAHSSARGARPTTELTDPNDRRTCAQTDSPFYKAENVAVPSQQMHGTFNTENPVFLNRLVTGTARKAKKMGIEAWWHSSVGIDARVQACNGGSNKCGIKNPALDDKRGTAPRCMSCNSE